MRIEPPALADLQFIARHLREADVKEVWAGRWDDPAADVSRLMLASQMWRLSQLGPLAQVYSLDAVPVAYLSATWLTPRSVMVHMLATDMFAKIAGDLTKHVLRHVQPALVMKGVARAECRAWEEHETSRRWLEFLGARAEARIEGAGRDGETFIQFAWRPQDVHFFGAEDFDAVSAAAPEGADRSPVRH